MLSSRHIFPFLHNNWSPSIFFTLLNYTIFKQILSEKISFKMTVLSAFLSEIVTWIYANQTLDILDILIPVSCLLLITSFEKYISFYATNAALLSTQK